MRYAVGTTAVCATLGLWAATAGAQQGQFPLAAPAGVDSKARQTAPAGAVNQGPFDMSTWKYGTAFTPPPGAKIWNPAKIKLMSGGKLVGGTVSSGIDPSTYCAMANAGYDFIWMEMQHSTMTWGDIADMIAACPRVGVPMIRLPDEFESTIQKATDIGAVGIIVPTVDTVEKAQAAVKWSKYPPEGRRSQGNGQYGALWGSDYRQIANDNMVVVIMIETPIGVANAEKIASVPGIDVIFAASTDLGNFSGTKQGDKEYEAMVTKIHDVTLEHRLALGGPQAWKDRAERPGFTFFQAPGEPQLIKLGAQANLAPSAPQGGRQTGVAATEGAEPR